MASEGAEGGVQGLTSSTPSTSGAAAGGPDQEIGELLDALEKRVHAQGAEMMAKLDDMGRRIDNLEATIQAEKGGKEESSTK